MTQAASKTHLHQEKLSQEDQEKLQTFGEWLSKEGTKFSGPKGGFQKCVDPELRGKLVQLMTTVDFAKGALPSAIAVLRISTPAPKTTEPDPFPSYLVPIQVNKQSPPTASGTDLTGKVTYISGSVAFQGEVDFLSYPVPK